MEWGWVNTDFLCLGVFWAFGRNVIDRTVFLACVACGPGSLAMRKKWVKCVYPILTLVVTISSFLFKIKGNFDFFIFLSLCVHLRVILSSNFSARLPFLCFVVDNIECLQGHPRITFDLVRFIFIEYWDEMVSFPTKSDTYSDLCITYIIMVTSNEVQKTFCHVFNHTQYVILYRYNVYKYYTQNTMCRNDVFRDSNA